ncbi:aminotransferase class I/II-fold pyridoxal phosphate-dependent enzyme [Nocardioides panzhihuensis]|uniref:DNA-binding transcriptional MocR family regulator n=1 Tax=Nocardioides panzhihuensis TaxID=860243 RepID=A0A7Z0DHV2_9ACTN|nr:aminotransferase class I/II-fold pyridoxal phosphate-dependent enzyme [Nocardioides panzhihuensis]NYI75743.1 DNA-binding transcriptional MocR family regulator [Nocardioides panzhihuensis]
MAATAPDLTVYVSGLSKGVATGLRVGFLVAPDSFIGAMERAIRVTTWNTPVLTTAIACSWIEDGTVARLEDRKRDDARARQALARRELAGLQVVGHPSSYFAWLPLPEGARADRIAGTLSRQQIAVATAEPFSTAPQTPQAIRVALGSTDLVTLATTLRTLRRVVIDDQNA